MTEPSDRSVPAAIESGEAQRPVLSILVPTYSRPATLIRTLSSVEAGGLANPREVQLLVSDNSPDISESIARPFVDRWGGPSRYIANRPTISPHQNFNQCIKSAAGRYILFLHDDDYLLPGGLKKVVDELRAAPDRTIYLFGVDIVDAEGQIRRHQRFQSSVDLTPRAALRRLVRDSAFVRMPVLVVERLAFDKVGMFDGSVGNPADFDLLVRLFSVFGVRCVSTTTAAYTVHVGSSTTGMYRPETIDAILPIFAKAASTRLLTTRELRRYEAEWFHQFILGGTYRALRSGDTGGAHDVLRLFSHPEVRALGHSLRWTPVRVAFGLIDRLPRRLRSQLMRGVGRLSLERFWMP